MKRMRNRSTAACRPDSGGLPRSHIRSLATAVLFLSAAFAACAQTNGTDNVTESLDARMVRARRAAANPYRWIIENAKPSPDRGADKKPAPVQMETRRRRAETAQPAAPVQPAEAAEKLPPQPIPVREASASPSLPALAPMVVPAVAMGTGLAPRAAATAMRPSAPRPAISGATGVTLAGPAAAPAKAAKAAEPVPAVELKAPTLVTFVEPDLSNALCSSRGCSGSVSVAFTIRPDGSVGNPVLGRKLGNELVNKSVLAAASQWRYQPLASPQVHQVTLTVQRD